MPSNLVHGAHEEAAWERAKRAVKKQYPEIDESNDRFYKLTTHIFENMKALDESTDAMALIDQDDDAALHRTGSASFGKAILGVVCRPLLKAYVRAHSRTLKDGRTIHVPAYF